MTNHGAMPVSHEQQRGEPVVLRQLIKEVMGEFAPVVGAAGSGGGSDRIGAMSRLEELQDLWKRVVGSQIAEHTSVVRYRRGVMTVEVDSTPLMAELGGFAKAQLTEGLIDCGIAPGR